MKNTGVDRVWRAGPAAEVGSPTPNGADAPSIRKGAAHLWR